MRNLLDRLYNWKFGEAAGYLDGMPENVVEVVQALARSYGDVGWALMGDSEVVVRAALCGIGFDDSDPSNCRLAQLVKEVANAQR